MPMSRQIPRTFAVYSPGRPLASVGIFKRVSHVLASLSPVCGCTGSVAPVSGVLGGVSGLQACPQSPHRYTLSLWRHLTPRIRPQCGQLVFVVVIVSPASVVHCNLIPDRDDVLYSSLVISPTVSVTVTVSV